MTKPEYEALTNTRVSDEDYYKIIEPMYMSLPSVSKQEFVRLINVESFDLKSKYNRAEKQAREIVSIMKTQLLYRPCIEEQDMLNKLAEEIRGLMEWKGYFINWEEISGIYRPSNIEFYNDFYHITMTIEF